MDAGRSPSNFGTIPPDPGPKGSQIGRNNEQRDAGENILTPRKWRRLLEGAELSRSTEFFDEFQESGSTTC